jgi:putative acetyltransferase
MSINIRHIQRSDNQDLARIIRQALTEFGADRPGTVFFDPTTDDLSSLFTITGSTYYVAEANGTVLGGAGIYPSMGLPPGTGELVKMYLNPASRGKGIGKKLMERCLRFARDQGYKSVYLETLPQLSKAVAVYEAFGFQHLAAPLGDTGHFGCSMWMILQLDT